jgi:molybdopterin synthase sulfur carrier subunit
VNEITVLVRYFAGAAAAAGVEEERLPAPAGTTLGTLVDGLAERGPDLAKVLAASSYLLDAVAARPEDVLADGAVLDVLPPFAGG